MSKNRLMLIATLALVACGYDSAEIVERHGTERRGLTMELSEDQGLVRVLLVNHEEVPVVVNKLFRIHGSDAEVSFEFEAVASASRSYGGRGQSHVPNPEDSLFVLMPRSMVGMYYLKEDIRDLYSVGRGCFKFKAVYENKMRSIQADDGKVTSNEVSICFDEK